MGNKAINLNSNEVNHLKYKALMDHAITAIFLTKPSGEIIEANKAAEKMFGYPAEELIQLGRKGIIDHDDENINQKLIERKEKGQVQGEITGIRKNGTRFPIYFTSTIFRIDDKEEYTYTLIEDISDRKQNELVAASKRHGLLEQREANYREIFDKALEGIFILEIGSGKILDVNLKACEIFGMEKKAIMNIGPEIFIPDLPGYDYKLGMERLNKAGNGIPQFFEWIIKRDDGRLANLEVSLEKVDIAGNDRILAFFRAIDDRIKSEQLLKESFQRFELVTKATNDAIWDWNIAENKVFWGEAYLHLFGKMDDSKLSDHEKVVNRLHPEERKDVLASASRTIKSHDLHWAYEHRYLKADGEYAYVNNKALIIRDRSGWAVRVIGAMQDITQQKIEANNQILITEISRQFNQPLNLVGTLDKVLKLIAHQMDFIYAECWLVNRDVKFMNRISKYFKEENMLLDPGPDIVEEGNGILGQVRKSKVIQSSSDPLKDYGWATSGVELEKGFTIPILISAKQVIGILRVAFRSGKAETKNFLKQLENLGNFLGPEIKRKQIEQDLNKLFNFAPDIIAVSGLDGCFKQINQAASDLLGYSRKELTTVPFVTFVHPEDKEKTANQVNNLRKGKSTHYFENRYLTKSGNVKWMAWTSISSPKEGVIYSVAKDITDKKELQVLLEKATKLARIGSWEVDLISNSIYWSEMTREIHETGPDFTPDLNGGISFYKKGENREIIEGLVREAIDHGQSWDAELQIITAKGNERWIRTIGEPDFVDGKCVKIHGSFQDINDRKLAEENTKISEERQKLIMNSALDAIICIDLAGNITFWNPQAENIFGWKEEEALGMALDKIIFPKSDQNQTEPNKFQGKKIELFLNKVLEFPALKKSGKEFPVELVILPINQANNKFYCAFVRDITERKRSESLLLELNENLKIQAENLTQSNEELEQFAYVASHDLQEPLRMVSSFLTQLERKYSDLLDEKGRKYIYFAVDGAKRMQQIILDLLEFSRVGRFEDKPVPLALNNIVNDVKALFQKEIMDKRATLKVGPLPVVHLYKTPIRQVFLNLIGNALKYGKSDTPVVVSVQASELESFWQIEIADNGIGIDPSNYDRIFLIFQRLHTREAYPGTGMGLALAKKIIETIGGKIWVEGNRDGGSTFCFTLPKTLPEQ